MGYASSDAVVLFCDLHLQQKSFQRLDNLLDNIWLLDPIIYLIIRFKILDFR